MTYKLLGWAVAALALSSAGCSSSSEPGEENVGEGQQALSATQTRVLGFETPASDWSASRPISSSSTVSQGSAALAITPNGYVEVLSIPLSSLGAVKPQLSFDLRLPQTLAWGDVRLVVNLPSKGFGWQDLGSVSLVGMPAGSYRKLTFALPANLETALESSYTDLRLRVVLNTPSTAAPLLLDNFDIADTGGSTIPAPANALTFTYPRGQALASVFMSASDYLQVDDRVTLAQAGHLPIVAGLGSSGVVIGAGARAYSNVFSGGPVALQASSHVYGFVKAAGKVTKQQTDVLVDGGITEYTPVPTASTSINVNFPPAGTPQTIGPDGPIVPLAPGSYASLDVRSRGRVSLKAGSYYFDTFNSEPQAEVQLNGAPIYIYVKSAFTYRGAFKRISGAEGQVLVGYLGTSTALLEAPFVGTISAPNGTVELRRPDSGQHRGSFFGKKVQAFSDSAVAFLPFNFSLVCPLGDTDKDGTFDCDDQCPRDANKTAPGVCGCGVSDVDGDGDKVSDCEDECPLDASAQRKGVCGCPSSPAHDGTVCGDGICRGKKVCNAGQCGDPNACKPANGCIAKYFDHKWYWFCPGPVSYEQARSTCGALQWPLAQVDSASENAFLATNVSASSYIGANDRTTSGQWRWQAVTGDAGDRFWNGGSDGRRYYARYSSWASGAPASGEHCATLGNNGTWSSSNCSSSAGFICEVQSIQGDEGEDDEHDPPCEILGTSCEPVTPASCPPNEDDIFDNLDEAATVALFKACDDACKDGKENTEACALACTGPATPPGPNDRCDDYALADTRPCTLESLYPSPINPQACDDDSDCPSPAVCGFHFPCDPAGRDGNVERCFATNANAASPLGSGKVCGIPVAGCPRVNDPTYPPRCNTTQICDIDPDKIQTVTDANGAGSDLAHDSFNPAQTFGEPTPEPSLQEPYPADNNPCAAGCDPNQPHPWCTLKLQEQPIDKPEVTPEKHGRSDGPAVSFDFDPRLRFDHTATLGAFGIPDLEVTAQAGFTAGVTFGIAGGGHVDVIDVMAGLRATECGINSSAHLIVFEQDFLPVLLDEATGDYPLPVELPDEAKQKACRAAIDKFKDAANRAKKAYRDATTLLKQYNSRIATAGTADNFSKQLCNDLVAQRPRGFPAGVCGSEKPEDTINRFIDYYERTVTGFGGADGALGLADLVKPLADAIPDIPAEFTLYDFGRKEEVTVAQVQFFIGPVPVNLEVLTTSDYGVSVKALAGVKPGAVVANMFALRSDSAAEEIAFVQAGGEPHAGVGLGVFAGVGFSAGGLTAKIGIEANLTLGELWVPAYAGAGLGLGAEVDHRKLSAEDEVLSSGEDLLTSKRYTIDVRYSALLQTKVRNILSGSVNGALKVKFIWFSKTWRKTLLSFTGFCGGSPSANIPACDLTLISLGGTVDMAEGSLPWATLRPELPFPKLQKITTYAAEGTSGVDKSIVGDFFYDSLCTCIDNTNPDEERECFRNLDCCDATPRCFSPPGGGKKECIKCQANLAVCNEAADCCQDNGQQICWQGVCNLRHGCHGDCNSNADCDAGYSCVDKQDGTGAKWCFGSGCVK